MEASEVAEVLSTLREEDISQSQPLQTAIANESSIITSDEDEIYASTSPFIPGEKSEPDTSPVSSTASVQDDSSEENIENIVTRSASLSRPADVSQQKWKNFLVSWILLAASTLLVTATITLSFISSSVHPYIIFFEPGTTIAVLNIGSTMSVFLLGELGSAASDNLRWALAARPKGIGLATFLGLGNATGLFRVAKLFFAKLNSRDRMWLAQIGIRLALAAILLSGVNFQTTYVNTSHPSPALGGPLEFNMTLWASPNPEVGNTPVQLQRLPASSTFFQPFGVLSDYTTVAPFSAPTENCSAAGSKCFSYVFPGTMLRVLLPTSYYDDGSVKRGVPIDQAFANASKESTHFVLANASAYQLEYYPVQQPNIEFNATDCVTLLWNGENWPGLSFCAKDVDDDVVASIWYCTGNGSTPCYGSLGTKPGQSDFAVQLHASFLRLKTAYSLNNYSVQPIEATVPPSTIEYSAVNILSYLNVVFAGEYPNATDYDAAEAVVSFFYEQYENYSFLEEFGTSSGIDFLRNILALPLYSSSAGEQANPDYGLYYLTTGYFVKDVDRLIISAYSLYTFTVLSMILLAWSASALVYCSRMDDFSLSMTQYPELDFAAQCCTSRNPSECPEIGEEIRELNSSISSNFTTWVKPKIIFLRPRWVSSDIANGVEGQHERVQQQT